MFKFVRILTWAALCAGVAGAHSIIPEPGKTELKQNTTKTLKLLSDKAMLSLGKDAYQLTVTPLGVHLASGNKEGRRYGLVTLQQLQDQLATHPEGIPCGVIRDKPRYPWRGLMVNPARHFIPAADLKKFVDLMAYCKFNKLHVRLTDNQGWRLPVPGYPKLKSAASKRAESFGDGVPRGGRDNRGWMFTAKPGQSYKPDPAYGGPEQETDHIIGVQATMRAEHLPTLNHLPYRTYPRACAIAGAGWSPMNERSRENFQRKVADHRSFILKRFSYDMERTRENEPSFK